MQQVPPLFIAESVLSNLEILQMLLVSFFYIKKKKNNCTHGESIWSPLIINARKKIPDTATRYTLTYIHPVTLMCK